MQRLSGSKRLDTLPRERVIVQKQERRLKEIIGEEMAHKWLVKVSQRIMRVSLQFMAAAFSSSLKLSGTCFPAYTH